MAGGPQGGKAAPVAGGQAVSEVACGVEAEASQRARRADRPRRVPLWGDARWGVLSSCGGTLSTGASARCRLLQAGVGWIRHRWNVRLKATVKADARLVLIPSNS